ncbi:MAG: leucine-rich repeat protein [Erysipelotrichales bacterium]|nr:leucine-rich repeat protein [Erysipelotrichales bacterium]
MRKKLLIFLLPLVLFSCAENNSTSSESSISSQETSKTPTSTPTQEETTNIYDFEFVENEDGTLFIKNYKNYRPNKVTIPESFNGKLITGILDYAFASSGGIKTIVLSKNIAICKGISFANCLTIENIEVEPENPYFKSKDGLLLNKLGNELIFCPPKKDVVHLDDEITKLADYAFIASNAKEIILSKNLKEIGERVFASTKKITTITIPDSVECIGEYAFNLSSIKSITLGKGMRELSSYVISNCSSLDELIIPGNIKVIHASAVVNNFHLKRVVLENGVEVIEDGAFVDNSTNEYVLPTSLRVIKDNAFIRNPRLKSVTIPEGVTTLGNGAFSYCEILESIYLPSTLEEIGTSLVAYDRYLETISMHKDNPNFVVENNVLYSKDKTRLISYPARHEQFEYEVSDGVEIIDREAFSYVLRLEKLTLPASITFIGAYTFRMTSSLEEIYYSGTMDQWHSIEKEEIIGENLISWNLGSSINIVHCKNGDVIIND